MRDVRRDTFQIQELRVAPYALPFRLPFTTARQTLTVRHGFVVWVRDSAGRWGVGEAAPLDGFGMESLIECAATLAEWQRVLPGTSVHFPVTWHESLEPAFGIPLKASHRPAALHGLECALLDLAAQAAGVPLSRWLHPSAEGRVSVNATLGATSLQETVQQARARVAEGFGTLKLKVGVGGGDADVARVEAVRGAVGPTIQLRADANESWSEAQALEVLRRLAPSGIEYVEQPVPAMDLAALGRLSVASPVPVAADEASSSEAGARAVLAARAASVLVLKPMALGGLLTTLQIAREAFAQSIPVVLTSMLEGVYGRTAALHAAAALPALAAGRVPTLACGLATGGLLAQDLVMEPPQPAFGRLAVPPQTGLGVGAGAPEAESE
jgi:o-succinylbenzoate synthase